MGGAARLVVELDGVLSMDVGVDGAWWSRITIKIDGVVTCSSLLFVPRPAADCYSVAHTTCCTSVGRICNSDNFSTEGKYYRLFEPLSSGFSWVQFLDIMVQNSAFNNLVP
ncbi:hypothetical protein JTB14_009910 [Gonioctena quinquepunctata]|nr:hypothetical protein JTB14_009910 [Gonioctena quinquepunctata]